MNTKMCEKKIVEKIHRAKMSQFLADRQTDRRMLSLRNVP